jgi:acetoin utilization deacetylase AcuC-like enzyme
MTTGFLCDERFLEHSTGNGHPESPFRIIAILKYLKTVPFYAELKQYRAFQAPIEAILAVHASHYIDRARELCRWGGGLLDSPDVPVGKNSFDVALLAAGGALKLADAVMAGEIENGFCCARPPGHHAEADRAMGFCLLNNIAILARYLQRQYGLKKIAIVDWDVHHGNGTQHIFESDPSVFYISLHQFPHYPGTGAADERGIGAGEGYTLNIPLQQGAGDRECLAAFSEQVIPALKKFQPDAILISAGFDAHELDPLGGLNFSEATYEWLTIELRKINRRVISLLEGGYNLESLPRCVAAHLHGLLAPLIS